MLTDKDWEDARGPECPQCHREVFRLVRGICVECYNANEAERIDKAARKAEKRHYWNELMKGRITLKELRHLHSKREARPKGTQRIPPHPPLP